MDDRRQGKRRSKLKRRNVDTALCTRDHFYTSQPRTGHTREPDPTHNELKHTTTRKTATHERNPDTPHIHKRPRCQIKTTTLRLKGRLRSPRSIQVLMTRSRHTWATQLTLNCGLPVHEHVVLVDVRVSPRTQVPADRVSHAALCPVIGRDCDRQSSGGWLGGGG